MRVPALALGMALFVSACGSGAGDDGEPAQSDAAGESQEAGSSETVTLRFGHHFDTKHPNHECGAQPMADALKAEGIELQLFPAAQLGDEAAMLEMMQGGNLDMTINGGSFLGRYYAPASVFDAAYAIGSPDHLEEVAEGEIGAEIWDGLREEAGLRYLAAWYYGTRHITANKPVRGPEDLAGLKLRVPDAPLYLANGEALGASVTPVAFNEVYLSLQQGVIDAQENPIPTIESMSFDEVQSHISLSQHVVQGVFPVIREEAWKQLSPEQQEALEGAAKDFAVDVRECIETQEVEILEAWRESGDMIIVEDVDIEAFRERASEIIPESVEWGDLYLRVQESGVESGS